MNPQESSPKTQVHQEDSQVKHGTAAGSPYDQTIDTASPISETSAIGQSVDDFSAVLNQAGLMTNEDVQTFLSRGVPEGTTINSAEDLAAALVDTQRLTKFQLQLLREGKTSTLVLGNYVVLEKLGAGGMGVVYKARQRRMKREVALKVLPETLTDSKDAVARFHREVEAAARLQHNNIAVAYDADEAGGVHFLAMEYVNGPNLSQYVKQHGPLPLPYAVALCLQAAKGLQHAHNQGIVHRDIKPGNLMVDQSGTLKILDMGLAHLGVEATDGEDVSELTQSGRVMGTVDYMAPEQAVDAKRADNRADIYSIGCTLYYLVTGKPLSPDGSITQKLLWHQTEEIPPLSSLAEGVSETLDAVALKMLGKKPEDRQQSMDEVVAQLDAVLSEMPVDTSELPELAGPLAEVNILPSIGSATAFDRATLMDRTLYGEPEAKSSRGRWIVAAAVLLLLAGGGAAMFGMLGNDNHEAGDGDSGQVALLPDDGNGSAGGSSADDAATPADEPFRKRIEWIFDQSGSVQVVVPDGAAAETIGRREDLPEGRFVVRRVKLERTALAENDLARLQEIDGLEELSLRETKLPDGSLAALAELEQLWSLNLSRTDVDDAIAESLASLDRLRDLNLSGTKITDATLTQLAGLRNLEKVYLADTTVTDAGIQQLYGLTKLRSLSLNGTDITATGHRDLRAALPRLEIAWDGADIDMIVARKILKKGAVITVVDVETNETAEYQRDVDLPGRQFRITSIDMSGNPVINNDDLALVRELRNVEILKLDGTAVTDDALVSLGSLSTLKEVDLGSMQVDDATVAAIKRALPDCEIKQSLTDQRATANWVIAQGGAVTVTTPDGVLLEDLRAEADLPRGPFTILGVRLIENARVDDEALAQFRGLAKLERLLLSSTDVSDAGLEHLAGCTGLRELDLSDTKITDTGARRLARLRSLKQLRLAGTEVSSEGLRSLINLPDLTHLSLARTGVADADLVHLKGMDRLTWLSLSGTPATDAALPRLASLRQLRQLFVDGTQITDAGVEELKESLSSCRVEADAPDPQRLAARWVLQQKGTVGLQDGDDVLELTRITDLPRDACVVRSVDLSSLERLRAGELTRLSACSALTDLKLSNTPTSDRELEAIARLDGLRRLSLSGTRVTDRGIAALAALVGLESLDVSRTRVTGRTLSALSGLTSLRVLGLNDCRLTDRSMRALADFTNLETLVMRNAPQVSDVGFAELAPLTKLVRLELGGSRVTDAIAEQLATYENLQRLDLSRTQVTDALVPQLAELENLQRLRLDGTEITDSTLAALTQFEALIDVDVRSTEVTKAAVDQLRASREGLRVQSNAREEDDQ
ncbi:MAG: hypothetical protein DWQ42_00295 [Planctomycetota bacterium]|nr:MAG: hypothetical protein DWQ42_00295 [Planctomycetota bacterium]REK43097.1 MAG: hypothetical protein DWQ46_12035 [Planctomycetota bacterium]